MAKKPKSAASKLTPTNIKADKDTLIAFGVPLGMPFSPDLVKKINSEAGGKDFGQYYVTPKKAHPYFSSYTINAYKAPINATYLVRASTGTDFCMDADVCKVKIDAVVNSLNKKYGNPHILKKTTIHGHITTAHNVPKKVVYKVGKSKIPNRSKEPRYNIELSSSSGRYTIKYADMDVNFSYNKLVEDKHKQKINRASKSVQQDDIDTGL